MFNNDNNNENNNNNNAKKNNIIDFKSSENNFTYNENSQEEISEEQINEINEDNRNNEINEHYKEMNENKEKNENDENDENNENDEETKITIDNTYNTNNDFKDLTELKSILNDINSNESKSNTQIKESTYEYEFEEVKNKTPFKKDSADTPEISTHEEHIQCSIQESIQEITQDSIHSIISSSKDVSGITDSKEIPIDYTKYSSSYDKFMQLNQAFFNKIGYKDISNHKILTLSEEVDNNPMTNNCEGCNAEFPKFFKKIKNWYYNI